MSQVPAGFKALPSASPFNELVGPLYEKPAEGAVSLDLDYAGAAELGDWMHSEVEVQRVGSRLAFATGYLCIAENRIVRMSGIFALPGRAPA
jgi:hypothetical protein